MMPYQWDVPFHYYRLPPIKHELVNWLNDAKIPEAIIKYIRTAKVIFGQDCRFDFQTDKSSFNDALDAFIIPIIGTDGLAVDTLAWTPDKDLFGTWNGSYYLGNPLVPRLNENASLVIFTKPKDWLAGGMKGILILNFGRLKYTDLGDFGPFEVQTKNDFHRLYKALKREPKIHIASHATGGQQ